MSFDGIFTHAMAQELNTTLSGGRVAKIQQPYENEIIITIRAGRKNHPCCSQLIHSMRGCKLPTFHLQIQTFLQPSR